MKLTSCVANIRTVLSENRRSQRLNKSSRVELRSSRTSALYLLHGPKCSTFGTPSVCHHTAQHSLRLMPPYTLYMLITVSRCGVMIKQFMTLLSMTSYAQVKFLAGSLGGLAPPKPLIMDNIFFKMQSAHGIYYIPWYIITSKFITYIIRQVC